MPPNAPEAVVLVLAILTYVASFTAGAFGVVRKGPRRPARALLLAAFALHAVALVIRGWRLGDRAIADAPSTIIFVTWCATLVGTIIDFAQDLRSLPLFLVPPVVLALAVGEAMQLGSPNETVLPEAGRPALIVHVATAIVAYGAFGFAAVLSVMYLFLETQLKKKKLGPWLDMPALDRLERVGGRFVLAGFGLLTLSLLVGFGYQLSHEALPAGWLRNPKTLLAIATWVACGVLVLMRARELLAGRRQVVATLVVFGLVLLTYLGAPLLVGGEHLPAGTARRD